MYNSKAAGNDNDYESFIDNMNEMSALLPTDKTPKHLGWERNNNISNEVRGQDRVLGNKIGGTENTIPTINIQGKKRIKSNKNTKVSTNTPNKSSRNMSGTWGQGSGGGQ